MTQVRIILAIAFAMMLACGSSYDPSYTIPADSKLQKQEPKEDEEILDEAGLLDEDEDEDEDEEAAEDGAEETASEPAGSDDGKAAEPGDSAK